MAFTKITATDLNGKGNIGMPDTPELTTAEMQAKLDELALDVIVPKFNNLVDELDVAVLPMESDNPTDGQVLTYDAEEEKYVNADVATNLSELGDVEVGEAVSGQFLRYNGATNKWIPSTSSASVSSLDAINDVSLTSVQDGDVLKWDATLERWINGLAGTAELVAINTETYNALPQSEKLNPNKAYFVYDAQLDIIDADDLDFDNTSTGIASDNVGDAIREIGTVRTFTLDKDLWVDNDDLTTMTDYPFVYALTVQGMTASKRPIVSIDGAGSVTTLEEDDARANIRDKVTGSNVITFYATDAPTVDLVATVRGD